MTRPFKSPGSPSSPTFQWGTPACRTEHEKTEISAQEEIEPRVVLRSLGFPAGPRTRRYDHPRFMVQPSHLCHHVYWFWQHDLPPKLCGFGHRLCRK